jgi:5-methylcytosine-specific restriction endonuclease McrA
MVSRHSVLVLNQDYQAIGICSAERAFVLVFLQKAEMLVDNPDLRLKSISREFSFPSIIRLHRYIRIPYKSVNLSRHNVFRRDNNRCVYCNSKDALTIDHVVPRSMGGRDSWDNLVTACQKCNAKKGNMTPEEAGMEMRHKPFRPSFVMYLSHFSGNLQDAWKPYLYMS